jgi:hypothetical protein
VTGALLIAVAAILIVVVFGVQDLALCRAAAQPTPPVLRPVGEDEESW